MANLVIPRREIWTKQPTEFVPLANGINKGQSRVFNPAFGAIDVATGKPLTLVGANPLISPVSAGLAFDTNAAACRYEIPLRAGDGIYQAKQYIVFAQFELTFVGSGPYGGQVVELSAGYGKQIYIGTSQNYTQSKRVACFIRPNNQTQSYIRTLDAGSNTEIVTVAIFCKTGFSPEFFAKGDGWTDYYKLPTAITNAADTFDKLTFCGSSYDAIDVSSARKITLGGVLAQPDVSAAMAMDLVQNPWQIFAPRETRLFVPIGGGGAVNATASGAFPSVSLSANTAGASGSASASGSLAAITLSAPTATASAGGSATASGSFSALSISPATATATATKSATASGAFAVVSLSAPTATASGATAGGANATGSPAQITISHATAIAIGSAVASWGFQSIGITAPSATASVGNGNATASGSWAAVSITAPTGYASSGFIRAPAGSGPTVIQPGSYRMRQSATSRPSNTGGRRY